MGDSLISIPSSLSLSPCLLPVELQKVPEPLPQEGQEQEVGAHAEAQGLIVPIR